MISTFDLSTFLTLARVEDLAIGRDLPAGCFELSHSILQTHVARVVSVVFQILSEL